MWVGPATGTFARGYGAELTARWIPHPPLGRAVHAREVNRPFRFLRSEKPTVTRLIVAVLLLLIASAAVSAQQPGKIPRVGVLRPGNPPPGDFGHQEAFEGGLRDLGWTPGSTILIEYRYAEGKAER